MSIRIPKLSPNSKFSPQATARNMAAAVPARWKWKPRAEPTPSTAALLNTSGTNSSTRNLGRKALIQPLRRRPIRSTITATPLAGRFSSPTTTIPARRRRFSSSLRNGARKAIPPRPPRRAYLLPRMSPQMLSEMEISVIFVQSPLARLRIAQLARKSPAATKSCLLRSVQPFWR